MNFHHRTPVIGEETIPLTKPVLSGCAQAILDTLERIRVHPDTAKYLEADERGGASWLPMDNICNGHVEGVSEEYMTLMENLSSALDTYLINPQGGHSHTFYELKGAGYNLRTGEKDSFGPLSAVIHCPNGDWRVCYG